MSTVFVIDFRNFHECHWQFTLRHLRRLWKDGAETKVYFDHWEAVK